MIFVVWILTALLVLNCFLLVLIILAQLPKKDAGAGMAFGGGAADALFGAGTGNALTKITKYATISFFVLALLLGYLQNRMYSAPTSSFEKKLQQEQQQGQTPATGPAQPAPSAALPGAAPAATNLMSAPLRPGTNAPAAPAPAAKK